MSLKASRIMKELGNIKKHPPWGISFNCAVDGVYDKLEAIVMGPRDSPYENGAFRLRIEIPDKYPFEPPHVKFITPIYHPNIDKAGRICLDLIRMPPTGSWKATVSLENLLVAIQALMLNPNPEDPLMLDIARQYKMDKEEFIKQAKLETRKYAVFK